MRCRILLFAILFLETRILSPNLINATLFKTQAHRYLKYHKLILRGYQKHYLRQTQPHLIMVQNTNTFSTILKPKIRYLHPLQLRISLCCDSRTTMMRPGWNSASAGSHAVHKTAPNTRPMSAPCHFPCFQEQLGVTRFVTPSTTPIPPISAHYRRKRICLSIQQIVASCTSASLPRAFWLMLARYEED